MEERIKELEYKVDVLEQKNVLLVTQLVKIIDVLCTLHQTRDEEGNYDLKYIKCKDYIGPFEMINVPPEIVSFDGKAFNTSTHDFEILLNPKLDNIVKIDSDTTEYIQREYERNKEDE